MFQDYSGENPSQISNGGIESEKGSHTTSLNPFRINRTTLLEKSQAFQAANTLPEKSQAFKAANN